VEVDEEAVLINKMPYVDMGREAVLERNFMVVEVVRSIQGISITRIMLLSVDEDKVILQLVQAARMVVRVLGTVTHHNLQVAVRRTRIDARSLTLKLLVSRCLSSGGRGERYPHPLRLKKKRSLLLSWIPHKLKTKKWALLS